MHTFAPQTLVGLFGCVLDYFSEIRRWVVAPGTAVPSSSTGKDRAEDGAEESSSAAATPSIVDRWAMQRLGLACSRTLGVWVAEDPESLPQRFLENLPVLLALDVGVEVRGRGGGSLAWLRRTCVCTCVCVCARVRGC